MDRLLANYLPQVLREVPELKALMAAEQPEITQLWSAQDNILENQFLISAGEYGVKRWERILKIHPKDTNGLEMRRARVLVILRLKLPYTIRWLRGWLDDLCGTGNYGLDIETYAIALTLEYDALPEAEKLVQDMMTMLQAVKPANMVLNYRFCYRSTAPICLGIRHTLAPEIVAHPYVPGAYAVSGHVQTASYTKTGHVITIQHREENPVYE